MIFFALTKVTFKKQSLFSHSSRSTTLFLISYCNQLYPVTVKSMANIDATPLGALGVLPQEIRDIIYLYAMGTLQDIVELRDTASCRPPRALHLCKTISAESTKVLKAQPTPTCKHHDFTFRLPTVEQQSNEEITVHGRLDIKGSRYKHKATNAKRIRFFTSQLCSDVPLAVVVHLALPDSATYTIHGASAWTEKRLLTLLDKYMSINVYNAQNFEFGPRDFIRAKDIENLAIAVRMAVCNMDPNGQAGYAGPNPMHAPRIVHPMGLPKSVLDSVKR